MRWPGIGPLAYVSCHYPAQNSNPTALNRRGVPWLAMSDQWCMSLLHPSAADASLTPVYGLLLLGTISSVMFRYLAKRDLLDHAGLGQIRLGTLWTLSLALAAGTGASVSGDRVKCLAEAVSTGRQFGIADHPGFQRSLVRDHGCPYWVRRIHGSHQQLIHVISVWQ